TTDAPYAVDASAREHCPEEVLRSLVVIENAPSSLLRSLLRRGRAVVLPTRCWHAGIGRECWRRCARKGRGRRRNGGGAWRRSVPRLLPTAGEQRADEDARCGSHHSFAFLIFPFRCRAAVGVGDGARRRTE